MGSGGKRCVKEVVDLAFNVTLIQICAPHAFGLKLESQNAVKFLRVCGYLGQEINQFNYTELLLEKGMG